MTDEAEKLFQELREEWVKTVGKHTTVDQYSLARFICKKLISDADFVKNILEGYL